MLQAIPQFFTCHQVDLENPLQQWLLHFIFSHYDLQPEPVKVGLQKKQNHCGSDDIKHGNCTLKLNDPILIQIIGISYPSKPTKH